MEDWMEELWIWNTLVLFLLAGSISQKYLNLHESVSLYAFHFVYSN
jgi:hypothetical protein